MTAEAQAARILAHLSKGHALTHLDALEKFDCARLAARIKDLRELGYNIHMEKIEVRSGKRIGSYTLIKRHRDPPKSVDRRQD